MRKLKRGATLLAALSLAVAGGIVGSSDPGTHQHPSPHPAGYYNASVHPPGWGLVTPAPRITGFGASVLPPATGPTETMYDSVTLSEIPSDAFAAAGYTSGLFTTWPSLVSGFPNAHKISIAISAAHFADCLDVEPGDAVPSQVPAWVKGDIAHGFPKPCVYSSLDEYVTQIQPALAAAGIARSQVFEWDAHYTFVAHIDPGFDATQYTDKCLDRNLDCSLATLPFFSIAQPAFIPTPPAPPGPPPATITHWRSARNSSFGAYHKHDCKTLVDSKSCRLFGGRVEYFQGKLWTVFRKWGCWGSKAKAKSLVCWVIRPTVSRWSQERDATSRAQSRNGCVVPASFGAPSHSRLCDALDQRERYFAGLVARTRREYR